LFVNEYAKNPFDAADASTVSLPTTNRFVVQKFVSAQIPPAVFPPGLSLAEGVDCQMNAFAGLLGAPTFVIGILNPEPPGIDAVSTSLIVHPTPRPANATALTAPAPETVMLAVGAVVHVPPVSVTFLYPAVATGTENPVTPPMLPEAADNVSAATKPLSVVEVTETADTAPATFTVTVPTAPVPAPLVVNATPL
jgi:hypothetical protein